MPVSHPSTHVYISANCAYNIVTVPPHSIIYTYAASINCTTTTSKICLPYYLLFPLQLLLFTFYPFLRRYLYNGAIFCLPSISVLLVWKSEKCLTQRLTWQRIQVWICAMTFSPLDHLHCWQDTPEPVTGFFHCGLSWLSRRANALSGCIISLRLRYKWIFWCRISSWYRLVHVHIPLPLLLFILFR